MDFNDLKNFKEDAIMINTIVQWATILSPIIAVVIALWASKKSAKDTDRKIAAIEDSTAKQIESVKELSRQMIDSTIKQVELEIEKNIFHTKRAKQEWEGIQNIPGPQHAWDVNWKENGIRNFQEKYPEREYLRYSEFGEVLKSIKKGLVESKANLR